MKKLAALLGIALFIFPAVASAGRVDLTTYYPAPHGEYQTVVYAPQNAAPFACTAQRLGAVYCDSGDNSLQFCNGVEWVTIGEAPVQANIDLGGYYRSTPFTIPTTMGGGWFTPGGPLSPMIADPGAVPLPYKYGPTVLNSDGKSFRVNVRGQSQGDYRLTLRADVDVDEVSGNRDSDVQILVQRAGSTQYIRASGLIDSNDAGANHAPQNPLPAGDCASTDNCTTYVFDETNPNTQSCTADFNMARRTGASNDYLYYRVQIYRQRNTLAVRVRNLHVQMTRLQS